MSVFFFSQKKYINIPFVSTLPNPPLRPRTNSDRFRTSRFSWSTDLLGNEKTKRTLDLEDDKTRIDLLDLDPDLDLHWNGIITEGFL